MTLETDLHDELASFQPEVLAFLEDSGFFELEGPYDPVQFYATVPKKVKEEYIAASEEKNSRIWDLIRGVLVGGAVVAGVQSVRRKYPRQVAAYEKKAAAEPKKYPAPKSAKDHADEYMAAHGGEFIKNMNRTDQKRLVAFIWSNAEKNERPLAGKIDQQPHLKWVLDQGNHRNETIVRTEKFRATTAGTHMSAQDAGFKKKTWHTAGDKRVRPSHRMLNGLTIKIDEIFPNGELVPGEATINCRCRLSYS